MNPVDTYLPLLSYDPRKKPEWAKAHKTTITAAYERCLTAQGKLEKSGAAASEELDIWIRRFFDHTASAKQSRYRVPSSGFGIKYDIYAHYPIIAIAVSTTLLCLGLALEWTEVYPGSIAKPVAVRVAGVVCKMLELMLALAYWGMGQAAYLSLRLYFAKGLVVALAVFIKGLLISICVPNTELKTSTDYFNLVGPTCISLAVTIMDSFQFALSRKEGDDWRESNAYLPFTQSYARFRELRREPYPGTGLDSHEKLLLVEALRWRGRRDG